MRIAKSTYSNLLATKILKAVGISALLLFIIYLCFAVTIVRVLPSPSVGFLPVKNITFPGGLIPAGEEVVVDMVEPQGSGMLDYLKQSFVPNSNAAVVRVEAGPWGNFQWSEGVVVYDEEILKMSMPEASESNKKLRKVLVGIMAGYGLAIAAVVGVLILANPNLFL